MADRYSQVVNAPLVGTIAKQLGLPQPVSLDRYQPGQPVVAGPVLSGGPPAGRLGKVLDSVKAERAGAEGKAKALLFDATGIADSTELVELQRFFYPAVPRLQRSGRAIVLGTPPAEAGSIPAHTAQRALEGFTRSLGKEIGGRGGRGRWRASPARSARRSAAAAARRSSSTSSRAPRTSWSRRCGSSSRRNRPMS